MSTRPGFDRVIVTCEHGGNEVPGAYRPLFRGGRGVLETHRGYDIGALPVARAIANGLAAPLHFSTVTRLLIDLNRSLDNRGCFSELSAGLSDTAKQKLIGRYYTPYRAAVEQRIAAWIGRRQRVLHVSVHSFTPVLRGVRRSADIGLLYDPRRALETQLCASWLWTLGLEAPGLRVRRNYPYRGASDGLTTALRRRFPARAYLGVELEMNQGLLRRPDREPWLRGVVVESLLTLPQWRAANRR